MRKIYEDGEGLQRVVGHEFLNKACEAYKEILLLDFWPTHWKDNPTYDMLQSGIEQLNKIWCRLSYEVTLVVSHPRDGRQFHHILEGFEVTRIPHPKVL